LRRGVLLPPGDALPRPIPRRRSPPSTASSLNSGETFGPSSLGTSAVALRSASQILHSLPITVHPWRSRVIILPFFSFFFLS
jgi:hypothetical protein